MEDDVPEGEAYLAIIDGKLQWVLDQPKEVKTPDQNESNTESE